MGRVRSPEELFPDFKEDLGLLAAPPSVQVAWTKRHRVPMDEMAQQFLDAIPTWYPRLVSAGLVPPEADGAVRALEAMLDSRLLDDMRRIWLNDTGPYEPEWGEIRALAQEALDRIA